MVVINMGSDRKINMKKFAKDVETTISAMRSGELGDDFALELVDDLQKQFPIEKVERLLKAYRSGSIKSIKILSDLLDSEYKNHLPEEKVANKKSKSRKSNRVIEIEDNDLDDDGFEFRRDFRRHFRFQLPYPLAESKVMSFKINGMVRKGKPLSNFIVLVVAVDINGVMHILDDTGKELAYLPLDHHSRLTAISYDGTDFNCPLIVTAAEDGSIHSIHLNVFRNGYLVGGARQMPVIDNDNIASPGGEGIAPKEIKRDSESVYTIQAYIHSKYRLPSLESTSQEGHCSVGDDGIEQCSTPHSALDSDSNPNSASASTSNLKAGQLTNKKGVDIGPYVTSMLINHKSVKDGHIVYAGDSEGRYFQLSARDGKVARHMVVSKGERIQASIRTGYSLAIVTGKNISFFQINKFTRSPIKCVAPQPIIDVQYDTRLASNVLAKLTTGEIVVFSTVKSRTLKNEQDLNEDTDIKSPSTICHIVKILKAETDHPVSKLVETYTSSPHVKKTDAVITPGTFFNVRYVIVYRCTCITDVTQYSHVYLYILTYTYVLAEDMLFHPTDVTRIFLTLQEVILMQVLESHQKMLPLIPTPCFFYFYLLPPFYFLSASAPQFSH